MKRLITRTTLVVFLLLASTLVATCSENVRVGAFNVRVFGPTKASNTAVMDILVKIVQKYDILLIQEIRDASETVPDTLVDAVNADIGIPGSYGHTSSERLGRTSAKEQYSYVYRTDRVTLVDTYQFDDSANDHFKFEPYCAKFHLYDAVPPELVLIGIRTNPSDVVAEMQALMDVHADLKQHWTTDNILIMGDMNADCSYLSATARNGLTLRTNSQFSWLIGDEVDTTTTSTDCAYDRLIISGEELKLSIVPNSAGVFRFDTEYSLDQTTTESVSDRYPVEVQIQRHVRVAAFNIRIFGRTKVSKDDVLSILVKIVQRYDIVLIQEIRDITETAIYTLIDAVNADIGIPGCYTHTMSERLGRTSAKEQYSYVYRTDRVTLLDTYQFDDSVDDEFHREPYCVKFRFNDISCPPNTDALEFVLIGLHTDPDEAVEEMEALVDVHTAVKQHWDTDDILIMGDLNADCSYASETARNSLELTTDSQFSWLIGDEVDTTTTSTDCTYDRFIVSGAKLKSHIVPNSAGVFRYDVEYSLDQTMTESVSDHYPIEVLISCSAAATTSTSTSTTTSSCQTSSGVRVSAFNVRSFGLTKAGNAEVMAILVQIVQRYDIVLIQEVRDSSLTVTDTLINQVNDNIGIPGSYDYTMSERLGRTSSKEQYAFIYRTNRVMRMDTYQYDDSPGDAFQREPYCVKFQLLNAALSEVALIGIHTLTSDVVAEMQALVDVHTAVKQHWSTDNIVIMGNMNADCSYLSATARNSLTLRTDTQFSWLIGDEVDTRTTSADCAYDRFIVSGNVLKSSIAPNSAGVFRFDTEYSLSPPATEDVSDHYPIEFTILPA